MARKKSSIVEDFVEIIARMPWWVGLAIALASYLFFSYHASQPISSTASGQPIDFSAVILKGFAGPLQFIFPVLAIFGSLLSAVKRLNRNSLFNKVSTSRDRQPLLDMSWQEFELIVGEAFRRMGYAVEERGGAGADGGVDLVLYRDGKKSLVQCKQWQAYKVGVKVIRELFGVMHAEGAQGGVVVTSGRFTDEARQFAKQNRVELIDGELLAGWIRSYRKTPISVEKDEIPRINDSSSMMTTGVENSPLCPICGGAMVKRVAKRGNNAGLAFWGCQKYPKCRGSLSTH